MKNAIYWFFIHPRYNKIIRAALRIHHLDPVCIESYLDSRHTSRTYTYGISIKRGKCSIDNYIEPFAGVIQ